jgi:hypothetical protein
MRLERRNRGQHVKNGCRMRIADYGELNLTGIALALRIKDSR